MEFVLWTQRCQSSNFCKSLTGKEEGGPPSEHVEARVTKRDPRGDSVCPQRVGTLWTAQRVCRPGAGLPAAWTVGAGSSVCSCFLKALR